MDRNPNAQSHADEEALNSGRDDLNQRLDDLRGLGLLPSWSESIHVQGEESLQRLSLSLIDLLESAQRRVIETSIQLLSLRELIAGVLNMRTPDEVAKMVTLYLHKAFDHERVLVGVYIPETKSLKGWVAVRRGAPRCAEFNLEGDWGGALRIALEGVDPIRSWQDSSLTALVESENLPRTLLPFKGDSVGPYIVYPLVPSHERPAAMGVLAVARGHGSPTMDGMDAEILQSLVESVATAMENVMLDEDVRREEAFRTDIMGSMASGLVAVDLAGRILAMNKRATEMTGFAVEDLRGSQPHAMDPTGDGILGLLRETLSDNLGRPRSEAVLHTASGRRVPVACATTPLRNSEMGVYGALVTFEDLSEIKAMEHRIRQLDRLAALGRFTSGVAHEIRNPLAGIAAGIQYLGKHLEGLEDQEKNIDFMKAEIHRLNRIVEDLFQVTHPQPPRKIPESPKKLSDMALRSLGDLSQDRKVTVSIDIDEDLTPVPVDPDQIQQVMINLIKNALEAVSEGGHVQIKAKTTGAHGSSAIELTVEDDGSGIDPDHLPHVFEPFFTKGKAQGTGLGLYVSHGIVERHGGELLAEHSTLGGAKFTVRLPLTCYDTTEIVG